MGNTPWENPFQKKKKIMLMRYQRQLIFRTYAIVKCIWRHSLWTVKQSEKIEPHIKITFFDIQLIPTYISIQWHPIR